MHCILFPVGYGQTQGVPHKTKKPDQVGSYSGEEPQWFRQGIDAALLAPTALAKQAFMIKGSADQVSIQCDNGRDTVKVLPFPFLLETEMLPPCSSTIRFASARPSPFPWEEREESPW